MNPHIERVSRRKSNVHLYSNSEERLSHTLTIDGKVHFWVQPANHDVPIRATIARVSKKGFYITALLFIHDEIYPTIGPMSLREVLVARSLIEIK